MKSVYFFDEGHGKDKRLLGGKGAGLCEMTSLGLPVPPGFVVTTDVCRAYYANGRRVPPGVLREVRRAVSRLEKETGRGWNSAADPLLVSVRSGAAVSMPGMMDTILNLGLNDRTVEGLARASGDERFAWDSYRRFVQLFGKVVFGVDDEKFEAVLGAAKERAGAESDGDLDAGTLRGVVAKFKAICRRHAGRPFPSSPDAQLEMAVRAVFGSWMGERAVVYREKEGITPDVADGTAVNVVAMVFGNMGRDSATGVVFTRDPGDGSRRLFGEYLVNAQGEDVVAGTRTPKPIALMRGELPDSHAELERVCALLEGHYREPQDVEFTVERGRFYLLQTRAAKTNAAAMVRISVDMVREGAMSREQGLRRLKLEKLDQLLHPMLEERARKSSRPAVRGIAASPGAASGTAVFDVGRAKGLGEAGKAVILVREETKPEDVPAFYASAGVLTSRGGKSSHAAVVARGMGKPCIVGTSGMRIDYAAARCTLPDGTAIREGETITIDGGDGSVYRGALPTVEPSITPEFRTILGWAGAAKRLGVRANADTPAAARQAREYGARGIGLCRTERMFNEEGRIGLFQDMIMATSDAERRRHLGRLAAMQRRDFEKILGAMAGHKVTIRLLDPPLHEFLRSPAELEAEIRGMGRRAAAGPRGRAARAHLERARELAEVNPMMGHRGVRVGVTYPEIYEAQIGAVFDAAEALRRRGVRAIPQVMVPQVGSASELAYVKHIFDGVAARKRAGGARVRVAFGTMIEVVRAALTAGELVAADASFFSFGTNDLTQATYSFSREDAEGKFLPRYLEEGLLGGNPFESLDESGVGRLIGLAVGDGRRADAGLEIGICGEHGGDPASIRFLPPRPALRPRLRQAGGLPPRPALRPRLRQAGGLPPRPALRPRLRQAGGLPPRPALRPRLRQAGGLPPRPALRPRLRQAGGLPPRPALRPRLRQAGGLPPRPALRPGQAGGLPPRPALRHSLQACSIPPRPAIRPGQAGGLPPRPAIRLRQACRLPPRPALRLRLRQAVRPLEMPPSGNLMGVPKDQTCVYCGSALPRPAPRMPRIVIRVPRLPTPAAMRY